MCERYQKAVFDSRPSGDIKATRLHLDLHSAIMLKRVLYVTGIVD